MATVTYETISPSLIENTTMYKVLADGVHKTTRISAIEGYVLHDNSGNWVDIDPVTGEETEKEAYYGGTRSVAASYDFTANPRELYAVPEYTVSADQIFGGGGNSNHETI